MVTTFFIIGVIGITLIAAGYISGLDFDFDFGSHVLSLPSLGSFLTAMGATGVYCGLAENSLTFTLPLSIGVGLLAWLPVFLVSKKMRTLDTEVQAITADSYIGAVATVVTPITAGQEGLADVVVDGELVRKRITTAEQDKFPVGKKVIVTSVEDNTLHVEQLPPWLN